MSTQVQNKDRQTPEFKTEVVCEVKRSDSDVYRISRKEYKGKHFVDLRIFYRSKDDADRLIPSGKGIWVEETLLQELITGLISARKFNAGEKPEKGNVTSSVICDIPVSEDEVLRISKGCGSKNVFVDIRRFWRKGSGYCPSKRKGIAIHESSLDDVITGLMRAEIVHAA